MLGAGVCWGVYSLLGRGAKAPMVATAGNFLRAVPFALVLFLLIGRSSVQPAWFAVCRGIGRAGVRSWLRAVVCGVAGAVGDHGGHRQWSVPVIAALGGVLLLGETISLRLGLATIAVLGGIALFIGWRRAVGARS